MPQEPAPALQILLSPLRHAQNLPKTIGPDADRYQHRDVAHLPGPAALEDDAIEVQVGKFTDDLAIAPRLDVPVNLLVKARDRARAHSRAPQCFGDVLDSPHRYSRQVHLSRPPPPGALTSLIPLDDRCLKWQPP